MYNPFSCEPLIKYKHPFSSVASSVGIQNPVIDSIGSQWKYVASWCGLTELKTQLEKRLKMFASNSSPESIDSILRTFSANFRIFINKHALQHYWCFQSKFSGNSSNPIIENMIGPIFMLQVDCMSNL